MAPLRRPSAAPAGDAFFVKVFRCGWEVRKKPSMKNQAKQIDRDR